LTSKVSINLAEVVCPSTKVYAVRSSSFRVGWGCPQVSGSSEPLAAYSPETWLLPFVCACVGEGFNSKCKNEAQAVLQPAGVMFFIAWCQGCVLHVLGHGAR